MIKKELLYANFTRIRKRNVWVKIFKPQQFQNCNCSIIKAPAVKPANKRFLKIKVIEIPELRVKKGHARKDSLLQFGETAENNHQLTKVIFSSLLFKIFFHDSSSWKGIFRLKKLFHFLLFQVLLKNNQPPKRNPQHLTVSFWFAFLLHSYDRFYFRHIGKNLIFFYIFQQISTIFMKFTNKADNW